MTVKLSEYSSSARQKSYVNVGPSEQGGPSLQRALCYAAHFQLRDLVISPIAGKCALANGSSIHGLSFPQGIPGEDSRSRNRRLLQVPFTPVCFSQGCGLVALGGEGAQLAVRSFDNSNRLGGPSNWNKANFKAGDNINNSISITPRPSSTSSATGQQAGPSEARLITSNNDQSIAVWDVHFQSLDVASFEFDLSPNISPILLKKRATLPFDTPVNYCSVSKDGKLMTVVGDTNEVFFYSCPRSDTDEHGYQLLHVARASEDASFSADWSRDNNTCAVASQDGIVTLFDVRKLKNTNCPDPATQIASYKTAKARSASRRSLFGASNHYGMCGAARVVKFSPGSSTELLAFTEQSRHFHLVDARSLDPSTQHTIELPPLKGNATPARPPVSSPESDWRTLLHPFGSVDSDVPRHARLRVEREPEPPTVSLLSTNRRQVPPGQWPCLIPRSPSNAPLLDPRGDNAETVASWSSPESSLHSFFYGDGLTSPRRPPWRDLAVHDTETRAPQLQSDGYLTLGDNPSQQRPREDRSPGIATEDMTTRAELDAGFGLLHIPTWADVSAHDPFSISGMDWDPSGQKLYLATSTGAYEYSVDTCGRSSFPEATRI